MYAAHILECAINEADPAAFDGLRSQIWNAFALGHLTDGEATTLSENLEKRKGWTGGPSKKSYPVKRASIFPPRKIQKSSNPSESAKRRRENSRHAMSPKMSAHFTNGELSVLLIVAHEVRDKKACDRSLAEIAARAGVCRAMAQRALRKAASMGLLVIEERPQRGRKNLTNVVRIVSEEWLTWLSRGPKPIGSTKVSPTDIKKNLIGKRPTFRPFRSGQSSSTDHTFNDKRQC